jgi:hypothetical protein
MREKWLPRRETFLKESDEPISIASKKDAVEPILTCDITLILLPSLIMFLRLKLLPYSTQSRTERVYPISILSITLVELPNLHTFLKERDEPKFT